MHSLHKTFLLSITLLVAALTSFSQQTYPTKLTVAKDGTGDYKTIQEAINAVETSFHERRWVNLPLV